MPCMTNGSYIGHHSYGEKHVDVFAETFRSLAVFSFHRELGTGNMR